MAVRFITMAAHWWLVFSLCNILVYTVKGDIFAAMSDVETLWNSEGLALDVLGNYLEEEYARLDSLKRHAQDCVAQKHKFRFNTTLTAEPLNLFLSIKRMHSLHILMQKNTADDHLKRLSSRNEIEGTLATKNDIVGSALALFRLQDTYKLNTKDLADGVIAGVNSSRPLTALECFELGKVAYDLEKSDFYHTLLWMQEADDRLKNEKNPSIKREEILDYLSYSMFQQGNVERALHLSLELKKMDPNRHLIDDNIQYYVDYLEKDGVKAKFLNADNLPPVKLKRDMNSKSKDFLHYEALCRGEKSLRPELKSRLTCYYKQNQPYLRLARLKIETLHLKPKIILLREVISDAEADVLMKVASPKFTRAGVVRASDDDTTFEASEKRTSKISWLKDIEHPIIRRVTKRVEDMTDLSCATGEYLQIANYGIGGHYEMHYDFAPEDSSVGELRAFDQWGAGNRIATVLFYLSQPAAGGATVFPDLNLAVFPSKNDAIFWHNLRSSGKGDMSLRHAACPVLSGVKWVANKWLHEFSQEFHRPCSIDVNEYE